MEHAKEPSLYDAIGGEEGVARLVSASVRILRTDPGVAHLRAIHQDAHLATYECHLREYLSGWLGGPPLYLERHGVPMLRERHRERRIPRELMLEWVRMMRLAVAETVEDPAAALRLEGAFSRMAESFVNA